jgi:putative restriction endonuclease
MFVPGALFKHHVDRLIRTLERQGATILVHGGVERRPAHITIRTADGNTDCMLYLWSVTHGGNNRPAHERRIQITGVGESNFPLQPGTRTIIGGFNEESGAWAFWDARHHSRFSTNSPSFQINIATLEDAGVQGLAAQLRPVHGPDGREVVGYEVAAAIAPDSLFWYLQHGESLHNVDEEAEEVSDLVDANPEEERRFIDESETPDQANRRIELIETLRRHREASFRPAVLQAYQYRCAICGTALKLVDAAHIVPVLHPQSTDDVTNGIALCRLHHAAYDNGLLGIQSNYALTLNPIAVDRINRAHLNNGLEVFRDNLPERIELPSVNEVRPSPQNLRLGLEARQFPSDMIQ